MRLPADATLIVIGAQDAMGDRPAPRAGADADAEDKMPALIAAWRAEGLTLVHIRRDSIAPNFRRLRQAQGPRLMPSPTPLDGETVIVNRDGSAFAETELERLLDEIGA